ncbi:hypothetical protein L3Y34_013635 [Caenorhabditis briggsae]|uniref:Uncharacterized protein n=1 Tax=Caenorhabditis briggsae TaxID=6238 RepID=A0AAE8ZXE3_CAEBR|nr:hypothetical protein L3Y34_013635 [Caenorhabditis briggsae]
MSINKFLVIPAATIDDVTAVQLGKKSVEGKQFGVVRFRVIRLNKTHSHTDTNGRRKMPFKLIVLFLPSDNRS